MGILVVLVKDHHRVLDGGPQGVEGHVAGGILAKVARGGHDGLAAHELPTGIGGRGRRQGVPPAQDVLGVLVDGDAGGVALASGDRVVEAEGHEGVRHGLLGGNVVVLLEVNDHTGVPVVVDGGEVVAVGRGIEVQKAVLRVVVTQARCHEEVALLEVHGAARAGDHVLHAPAGRLVVPEGDGRVQTRPREQDSVVQGQVVQGRVTRQHIGAGHVVLHVPACEVQLLEVLVALEEAVEGGRGLPHLEARAVELHQVVVEAVRVVEPVGQVGGVDLAVGVVCRHIPDGAGGKLRAPGHGRAIIRDLGGGLGGVAVHAEHEGARPDLGRTVAVQVGVLGEVTPPGVVV